METLKVGQIRETKSGDKIRILSSTFLSGPITGANGKPLNAIERKEYIFNGEMIEPGPKRKDKTLVKGLKWDSKGKSWGSKKDKSFDLV